MASPGIQATQPCFQPEAGGGVGECAQASVASLRRAFYPAELQTLMHDQSLLVPEGGSVPVPGSGVAVGVGVRTALSALLVPDDPLQNSVFVLYFRTNNKNSLNVYVNRSLNFTPCARYPRG